MTLDDAIEIQTFAMMAALDARLASDPATAGLALPEGFLYDPMGSGQAHVHYGVGWHQPGGANRRGELPGEEVAGFRDAWDRDDPATVRPSSLDALTAHAHRAIRMGFQAVRPYDAPTWATLVHPVPLALMLGHDPDRSIMPLGTMARDLDASRRWAVDDLGNPSHTGINGTVATGECWMERGQLRCSRMGVITPSMACVTVVSVASHTTVSMPGTLPETVRTADLAGRALGDIAALPPCGDAEIDALAAACLVTGFRELANGIELTIAPAPLVPYGPAPDADTARAMGLAPEIG